MKPRRRDVLVTLGAAGLLPACIIEEDPSSPAEALPTPDRAPEPPPFEPSLPLDAETFAWGLQVGDVTASDAVLTLRALESEVQLRLLRGSTDAWEDLGTLTLTLAENQGRTILEDLEADTVYSIVAETGTGRSPVTRFRTALAADGYRKIVFGATSCLGGRNPSWENLARAAEENFDFMLFLGDTVYADGSLSLYDFRRRYQRAFAKPSLQALFSSTSVIATWDDHEVDNNYEIGTTVTEQLVATATEAFRESMPQQDGLLWRSLSWGEVLEIFILDSRSERDPSIEQILSPEQLAWATESVRSSTAAFKIVLCSVHLTDHEDFWGVAAAADRWQGFPEQRAELVAALAETPGTLVITGDMHYGAVQRLARAGDVGDNVWEVAAGPAGSTINSLVAYALPSDQYPHLVADWTYTRFEADPGTMTVRVQFIDDEGTVLVEDVLDLS